MEQKKEPVKQFFYSDSEWARLGCGPLPPERDRSQQLVQQSTDGLFNKPFYK